MENMTHVYRRNRFQCDLVNYLTVLMGSGSRITSLNFRDSRTVNVYKCSDLNLAVFNNTKLVNIFLLNSQMKNRGIWNSVSRRCVSLTATLVFDAKIYHSQVSQMKKHTPKIQIIQSLLVPGLVSQTGTGDDPIPFSVMERTLDFKWQMKPGLLKQKRGSLSQYL